MAETLDLTTPIVPPSRASYTVKRLNLDWPNAAIQIWLIGSDGIEVYAEYIGAQATTLLIAFNKVNLSVKSLQRRVLEQLVTDGKLPAGTVTGAPA
jgi:hypothetical protein